MVEVLDPQLLTTVAEVDHVASRAGGRDGGQFVERELALGKNVQDLATNVARGSNDRDPITHFVSPAWAAPTIACDPRKRYGPRLHVGKALAWGESMRRPIVLLGLLLVALLASMAAKSWLVQTPPVRASSATGEFNANR